MKQVELILSQKNPEACGHNMCSSELTALFSLPGAGLTQLQPEAFHQPHRVQLECDRTLGKSQETLVVHPGACLLGHQQFLSGLRSKVLIVFR